MGKTAKDPERRQQEKRDRFLRIAPKRMSMLTTAMRRLANCANRSTYAYTPEEVEAILDELQLQVQMVKERFGGRKAFSLAKEEE